MADSAEGQASLIEICCREEWDIIKPYTGWGGPPLTPLSVQIIWPTLIPYLMVDINSIKVPVSSSTSGPVLQWLSCPFVLPLTRRFLFPPQKCKTKYRLNYAFYRTNSQRLPTPFRVRFQSNYSFPVFSSQKLCGFLIICHISRPYWFISFWLVITDIYTEVILLQTTKNLTQSVI